MKKGIGEETAQWQGRASKGDLESVDWHVYGASLSTVASTAIMVLLSSGLVVPYVCMLPLAGDRSSSTPAQVLYGLLIIQ